MATPILDLDAVRGTDFSEIFTLANDLGAPVNTTNAQGLFVIREYNRGPVVIELNNTHGISFGTSNVEVRLTEAELELITYNKLWYDFFIQLQGDTKKKISRGNILVE